MLRTRSFFFASLFLLALHGGAYASMSTTEDALVVKGNYVGATTLFTGAQMVSSEATDDIRVSDFALRESMLDDQEFEKQSSGGLKGSRKHKDTRTLKRGKKGSGDGALKRGKKGGNGDDDDDGFLTDFNCGDTVNISVRLTRDVMCNGRVVNLEDGADFDLNGYTLRGNATTSAAIGVRGHGSRIYGGRIQSFAVGVFVSGVDKTYINSLDISGMSRYGILGLESSDVHVRDCVISDTHNDKGSVTAGIAFIDSNTSSVKNVVTTSQGWFGIHLRRSNDTTIEEASVVNTEGTGISLLNSTNVVVKDVSVQNSGRFGLAVTGCTAIKVSGAHVTNTTVNSGVAFLQSADCQIEGSSCEATAEAGILSFSSTDVTIRKSNVALSGLEGIAVVSSDANIVEKCTVLNGNTDIKSGILVVGLLSHGKNIVRNNEVRNYPSGLIVANGATDTLVHDNEFKNLIDSGILVAGVSGAIIDDNYIKSTENGIEIETVGDLAITNNKIRDVENGIFLNTTAAVVENIIIEDNDIKDVRGETIAVVVG